MKKVIRLTESDLTHIVRRVIKENEHHKYSKMNSGEFMGEIDSLCDEVSMIESASCSEINVMEEKWDLLNRALGTQRVDGVERSDEFSLCGAKIRRFKRNRCTPRNPEPRPMRPRGDSDEDRWSQYK
jgi:hypothetical protein